MPRIVHIAAGAERTDPWLIAEDGLVIFRLPTGLIVDTHSLMLALREWLPLDPPVALERDNWNAMSDSIFGGLVELPAPRIGVIWPDASVMARYAPNEFARATEVLERIATMLRDSDITRTAAKDVRVYLGTL